ncbi:MAG: vWA domain-containing protein, partial [Bacillota bacterium]|nr:vWA domain-containing protein [Bacillota bacterium]
MRQKFRKSLSFLLSLVLLFTVMPTAYADLSELGAKSFRFELLDEDEDDVWGGTSAEEEEVEKSELEELGSDLDSTPADDNGSIDEEAQKGLSAGGLENPEAITPILRSYNPFRKGGPGTKGGGSSNKPGEFSLDKTATPSGEEGVWDMELTITAKDLAKSTDVVLVVDRSSSMNEDFETGGVTSDPSRRKLHKAKEAAKSFVENLIQVSDQGSLRIALVSYSDNARINQTLTNNKESLIRSIDSLSARGATHTQAGIKWARDLLKGSVAERQIIVLLSDGEPTYAYNILEKYWYDEPSKVTPGLKVKRYPDKIMSPLTTEASKIYFLNGESFELTEHPFKYRETIKTVQELYMDYENSTPHFDTEKRKSPRFADNAFFAYESDAKRDDVDMINVYNQTISEANIAMREGYKIYTVGLSLSAQAQQLMDEVGIDGSYSSTPEDLKKIYEKIASRISFAATDAIVTDPIGDKFDLVVPPGMKPEETIKVFDRNGNELAGAVITWDAANKTFTVKLGTVTEALSPIKIQYKIRINPDDNIALPGVAYDTNGRTYITYTDSNGNPNQVKDFPIPKVGKDAASIIVYELLVDKDGNILKTQDGFFGDKAIDKNDFPLNRYLFEHNGKTSLPLHREIRVDAKPSVEKVINGEKKVFQLATIKVARGTQANSEVDITVSPFVKEFDRAESVEIYFAYLMNEKVDLILPDAKDLTKVY